MKKYIGVLLLWLVSGYCMAQAGKEKEVQESVKQLFAALTAKDSMAMKYWSTADLTLIEYGTVWNIDTIIKKGVLQNTAVDFSRQNDFEFLSTTVQGNMALVSYRLTSQIKVNGKSSTVRWIESVTLLYQDKRWKVRLLHSTLLNRSNQ